MKNRDTKLADLIHALNKRKGNDAYNLPAKLVPRSQAESAQKEARELSKAKERYDKSLTEIVDQIKLWRGNDPVTEMYRRIFRDGLFEDLSYSPSNIDEYTKEFRRRLESDIPPGYKDRHKDDEGIGDFLIWKTLLQIAIARRSHLAFVTGEQKSDWFVRVDQSPVFPRIELVDEYRRFSGGKLIRLLSLHELLREFGAKAEVVKTVESAEEAANSEIRAARSLSPRPPSSYHGLSTTFWLPVGATNSFVLPGGPNREILVIQRQDQRVVTVTPKPGCLMYYFGSTSAPVFVTSIDKLIQVPTLIINDEQSILVVTQDGEWVGMKFQFYLLERNNLIAKWSFAPAGSSIMMP
jgi:hypothetical protein